MKEKRKGSQTIQLKHPVFIIGTGAIAGETEAQGPFRNDFDCIIPDALWGEDSFEKAEKKLFGEAVHHAMAKAGITPQELDFLIGGDLLNQIISASYFARDLGVPFFGIYGACSSMAESMALGAMLVDGGFAQLVACATSSHFATAERQYRFPLEMGTSKTPTSQTTVTAGAANILSAKSCPGSPKITGATVGNVVDFGIKDANNMGAAMAPAALETIATHLEDAGETPEDYDLILTGDLGTFGSELLLDMGRTIGLDLSKVHRDCGAMIFDGVSGVRCGGSGCGCGGSLLNGHYLKELQKGNLQKILFVATGALLSPTILQQGESIPGVAHAIVIERGEE